MEEVREDHVNGTLTVRLERGGKSMYAIVTTGGKQYKVEKDTIIKVEKLDVNVDDEIALDVIMVNKDGEVLVGNPVAGAKVVAKVVAQAKAKKIIVYKYKSKKNERKRQGHRQPYTALQIVSIEA